MKPETIEKLRDFAIEEGILGRKFPENAGLDAAFELNFPPNAPAPQKLALIFPTNQNFFLIEQATQVSPIHQQAFQNLSEEDKIQFFTNLKKFFLRQNLQYNIEVEMLRWRVSEIVYEGDELTKNLFFTQIRRVFNASIYANILIDELCRPKMSGAMMKDPNSTLDKSTSNSSLYM